MKKLILFATAALFIAGVSFANNSDKGKKKKKCAKSKTCCTKAEGATKSCCKDKSKTVAM
ncbi:MAG: hypothetical protein WCJ85_07110 [Chitinophagaceae bacterium]